MGIFAHLRKLRAFEQRHLAFLLTLEDFDVVHAIGMHQEGGALLTLKHMLAYDIGSVATLQRRLARLKRLGVVLESRSAHDRRNVHLELSPRTLRTFQRYSALLGAAASDSAPD